MYNFKREIDGLNNRIFICSIVIIIMVLLEIINMINGCQAIIEIKAANRCNTQTDD